MHLNLNSDLLFHCLVSNQQGKLEKNQDEVSKSIFRHTYFCALNSLFLNLK